jgi:molybdenum cofactor biosynthesis enzyme MoaA
MAASLCYIVICLEMIEYCTELRLGTYVTTNGILLKEQIDTLYQAGLRYITIGFYGNGEKCNKYVQRKNSFERLDEGLETVRERYGLNVHMKMNWLLMRSTCNVESLYAAWNTAQEYKMRFEIDLIHYSLPYFFRGLRSRVAVPSRRRTFYSGNRR